MKQFLLIIILFIPFLMLAQKAPIWAYSLSWSISDLAKNEIGIDYDFLKTDRQIFSVSTGFKWHHLDQSFRYTGTKTNYFVATNQYHHNYIKMNRSVRTQMEFSNAMKDTEYFNNTQSLTRLGSFAPAFSIPIGFSYLRQLGPKLKRIQIWLKSESIVFFHKGYQYSSRAVIIQSYGYAPDFTSIISKYQENVTAKKKVESNLDFALGILTRVRLFNHYFIGLNSKVQFMPKRQFYPSSYHGLQRVSGRIVVTVGKYLNQAHHQNQVPNSTFLE